MNVQLTFEEFAVGEGTTDLRIFAGHKVTHSVSTQSASQSNSSQAGDHGGARARPRLKHVPSLEVFIVYNAKCESVAAIQTTLVKTNSALISAIISQSGCTAYAVIE